MRFFINGFWGGFLEKTDGVHCGIFEMIFKRALGCNIEFTNDIHSADALLESHFSQSVLHLRPWSLSVFFSGEASIALPAHHRSYTIVLGAQPSEGNYVPLPLALCYDICKPVEYPTTIQSVPPKNVCAVISSPITDGRYRYKFIEELQKHGIQVDMWGGYGNNTGRSIEGSYFEQPIIHLFSQYKIVLALENTEAPNYITEKILNPLRAGTIPVYFGSSRVNEYISAERFIQVHPNNAVNVINTIQTLCTNQEEWLKIVNKPIFMKTSHQMLDKVVEEINILLTNLVYSVEIIGNMNKEPERKEHLQQLISFYNVFPDHEVYGEDAYKHPLYKKFNPTKKINAISLAINHVTLLRKYAYKNKYLVIFESDALPVYDMEYIHSQIIDDIKHMQEHSIDFAFIGKGCCSAMTNKEMYGSHLYNAGYSRCTESYIVSPQGIIEFLNWFDSKDNHDVIDWAFNHYFKENPNRIGCWRNPELFEQGSIRGFYRSLVPI